MKNNLFRGLICKGIAKSAKKVLLSSTVKGYVKAAIIKEFKKALESVKITSSAEQTAKQIKESLLKVIITMMDSNDPMKVRATKATKRVKRDSLDVVEDAAVKVEINAKKVFEAKQGDFYVFKDKLVNALCELGITITRNLLNNLLMNLSSKHLATA